MTTHAEPIYEEEGIVHYCVANMPGAVPHTSTLALTNATLPYVVAIAAAGDVRRMAQDGALRGGINTYAGHITNEQVALAFGLPCERLDGLL